jgi:hypothetical protein
MSHIGNDAVIDAHRDELETEVKEKGNNISEPNGVPLRLMSVGCGVDGTGMVYPMLGWDVKTKLMAYDMENGNHINDIEPDDDWTLALSEEDRNTVNQVKESLFACVNCLMFTCTKHN